MVSINLNGVACEEIPSGVVSGGSTLPDAEKESIAAYLRGVQSVRDTAEISEVQTAQSAARKRLEKLKAKRGATITPFEFEGETYHLKAVPYSELTGIALSVSRDGHNVLNITDEGGVLSVTAAVLHAVVCDETGAPYFAFDATTGVDEIADWMSEPAAASLVGALFTAASAANPDIFGTLKNA